MPPPAWLLQVCASRLAYSGLEGLWDGSGPLLSQRMRHAVLQRTARVLSLLVDAGASPLAARREGVPGLSPRAWAALRPAATAWPDGGWSRGSHRRYHGAFRAGARELLLVAHRGFLLPATGSAFSGPEGKRPGGSAGGTHAGCSSGSPSGSSPREAQGRCFTRCHLPPLAVERAIALAAERQGD